MHEYIVHLHKLQEFLCSKVRNSWEKGHGTKTGNLDFLDIFADKLQFHQQIQIFLIHSHLHFHVHIFHFQSKQIFYYLVHCLIFRKFQSDFIEKLPQKGNTHYQFYSKDFHSRILTYL